MVQETSFAIGPKDSATPASTSSLDSPAHYALESSLNRLFLSLRLLSFRLSCPALPLFSFHSPVLFWRCVFFSPCVLLSPALALLFPLPSYLPVFTSFFFQSFLGVVLTFTRSHFPPHVAAIYVHWLRTAFASMRCRAPLPPHRRYSFTLSATTTISARRHLGLHHGGCSPSFLRHAAYESDVVRTNTASTLQVCFFATYDAESIPIDTINKLRPRSSAS